MKGRKIISIILKIMLVMALLAGMGYGIYRLVGFIQVKKYGERHTIYYYDEYSNQEYSFEVKQDNMYAMSTIPTREGYEFLGLFDENDVQYVSGNGESYKPFSDGQNISLVVKWEKIVYTIKFSIGDMEISNSEFFGNLELDYNEVILTNNPKPVNDVYKFDGWYSSLESSATCYANVSGPVAGKTLANSECYPEFANSKEIIFYAKFSEITYDVAIFRDGASGVKLGDIKVTKNDKIDDYVAHFFEEFSVVEDNGKKKRLTHFSKETNPEAGPFTDKVTEDMRIYGKWTDLYDITIYRDCNSTNILKSFLVIDGDKIGNSITHLFDENKATTINGARKRLIYVSSEDYEGAPKFEVNDVSIVKNTILYGQWENVPLYTVKVYKYCNTSNCLGQIQVYEGDSIKDSQLSSFINNSSKEIVDGTIKRLSHFSKLPIRGNPKFTDAVMQNMNIYGQWNNLGGQWTGLTSDYVLISRISEFNNIRNNPSGKYALLNSIDIGTWNAPFEFKGSFDGGGYKITYNQTITLNSGTLLEAGLFSKLRNANVRNLKLDVNVSANRTKRVQGGNVAILAIGGLASQSFGTTNIQKVSVSGSIYGTKGTWIKLGGIVGYFEGGIIDQCKNSASLTSQDTWLAISGGIVGEAKPSINSYIRNSYNEGKVYSDASAASLLNDTKVAAGGIIGQYCKNSTYTLNISNSYNNSQCVTDGWTGNSNGWKRAGAIVGSINGGIEQGSESLTLSNCYWNNSLCSSTVHNASYAGATGLSSDKIQQPYQYTGGTWTNSNIWTLQSGYNPKLTWE